MKTRELIENFYKNARIDWKHTVFLFRFTCYDSGKAYSEPGALIDPDKLRKEMVTIGYETNVLGFKGTYIYSVFLNISHVF